MHSSQILNSQSHIRCKERNLNRVNVILPTAKEGQALIGLPTKLALVDCKTENILVQTQVSTNDWVYILEYLTSDVLLVAIGARLVTIKLGPNCFRKGADIVKPSVHHGKQKAFISSVKRLSTSEFALAKFDGKVDLVDVETCSLINRFSGHSGRVWTVERIAPKVITSGADDGKLIIWDIRAKGPMRTLDLKNGRVSNLLSLNQNLLVSSSCPDRPTKDVGASIDIFDVRFCS